MSVVQQDVIMTDVLDLIKQLARDWEYSGEITPETWLFADLGFESIDTLCWLRLFRNIMAAPFHFRNCSLKLATGT